MTTAIRVMHAVDNFDVREVDRFTNLGRRTASGNDRLSETESENGVDCGTDPYLEGEQLFRLTNAPRRSGSEHKRGDAQFGRHESDDFELR
jgi:hypothetical protein